MNVFIWHDACVCVYVIRVLY